MTTPTPSQPAVTAVPSSSSSSPFPDAPAPWKNLKAEGFWFLSNNQPTGPGTYDPLEASASFASPDSGAFTGGLLTVMLVRYTDTPVGTTTPHPASPPPLPLTLPTRPLRRAHPLPRHLPRPHPPQLP